MTMVEPTRLPFTILTLVVLCLFKTAWRANAFSASPRQQQQLSLLPRSSPSNICRSRKPVEFLSALSSSGTDEEETETISRTTLLPSIDSLKNGPFMKQVEYGSILTQELKGKNSDSSTSSDELRRALEAQLSHSDGIRGFMVSYLTYESDEISNDEPEELVTEAIIQQLRMESKNDDLVGLMCMNVVMPTAMVTMHTVDELSQSSKRTARKGAEMLKSILEQERKEGVDCWGIESNVEAICHASKNGNESYDKVDSSLVEYWNTFFEKWEYQSQQKDDIYKVASEVLE